MRVRSKRLYALLTCILLLITVAATTEVRGQDWGINEASDFAKRLAAMLQTRDFASLERTLDPELKAKIDSPLLEKAASQMPAAVPIDIKTVGYKVTSFNWARAGRRELFEIGLQYQFPENWVLFEAQFRKAGTSRSRDSG